MAQSVEDQCRGNVVAHRLSDGGDLTGREEESIRLPIGFLSQVAPRDPEITGIVDIPSPDRLQCPVDGGPIGSGWRGKSIEAAGHDEVQGGHPGQEEEVQVFTALPQAAGEGDRLGRMAEPLGMDREVSLELFHETSL